MKDPAYIQVIRAIRQTRRQNTHTHDCVVFSTCSLIFDVVRQGCILSPVLFALAIYWIVRTALKGLDVGLQWTDGNRLSDLDYAGDIVLVETSRDRMQQLTETVEIAGKKIGLQMNVKKCKTMVSNSWADSKEIRIGSTEFENVDDFCYLGSWLSTNGNCDKDCQIRIGKASSVSGRLKDIWRNKHISLNVKVRFYESLVMSTMLYSAELWPLSSTQKKKLDAAHHKFQRRLLGITWKDKARNENIRNQTKLQRMDLIIKERRLRWLGHVLRMEDDRIPKQAMYWQMESQIIRKPGRPRMNWIDTVARDLKSIGINCMDEAEQAAVNRKD